MTKKVQRMTPILILPWILPTPPPKKWKKYPRFWAGFVKVGFEVGFNPAKKQKNIIDLPLLHCSQSSALSRQPPLCSSNDRRCLSAAPLLFIPCLSPAVVVLRLCRRTYIDCCVIVVVVSAIVTPPPLTIVAFLLPCRHYYFICRISSAAVVLPLNLPSLLICHCTLVDCWLPSVMAAPLYCPPFCHGCWGGHLVVGVPHLWTCRWGDFYPGIVFLLVPCAIVVHPLPLASRCCPLPLPPHIYWLLCCCRCCQRHHRSSATNRSCFSVAIPVIAFPSATSCQPPSSSTSSYRRHPSAAAH